MREAGLLPDASGARYVWADLRWAHSLEAWRRRGARGECSIVRVDGVPVTRNGFTLMRVTDGSSDARD